MSMGISVRELWRPGGFQKFFGNFRAKSRLFGYTGFKILYRHNPFFEKYIPYFVQNTVFSVFIPQISLGIVIIDSSKVLHWVS